MSPGIPTRLLATQSDERLLALVRQGHERAFEALVNRYRKQLLCYCRRLPIPDTRGEDIVQLALLKTWIAVREGAEVRDLKAWLYRVVHNTAINAIRDAAHDGDPIPDPALRLIAREPDPGHRLAMREALAEVAALPALQREVILRTAVAGHSHEQVARELGITDGAVRGLLYRARVTLRAAITAFTPPPLLGWLAGRAEEAGPAPERLTELAAGGGTAGLGGLLLKGGVLAVTAGTVITGATVAHLHGSSPARHSHAPIVAAAPVRPAGAADQAVADARLGAGASAGGHSHSHRGSPNRARLREGPGAHGESHASQPGEAPAALWGRPAPRSTAPAHHDTDVSDSPSGQTGQSAPQSTGSTPGSGQGGGSSQAGGSGPAEGEPVGSTAGAGSGGSEGTSGQGNGSGGEQSGGEQPGGEQSGAGSGSGGAGGSGGAEGSGGSSEAKPTGGSSGEQSGSLVGTVVHEVGSILEHLLP
jgi:RNA polymerase sigma factor (sigma-70 family)